MALFGRKDKPSPRTLTASGVIVDLANQDVVQTLAMTRAAWQPIVWNYRRSIGELGQALRMKANLISKVGFTAAYQPPGEDEPIILTGDPKKDKDQDGKPYVSPRVAQAAIECVAALPWDEGYGWTGRIVTGFDVPGEVWLHGYPGPDGEEEWKVRSTSEVVPSGTGGLAVVTQPGVAARPLDPENETLIRLWVPDPEFGDMPDSPLRTLQDVCEDVILAGREIRAAAMSRIAANGILKVPNGVAMVRDGEPVATPENSTFVAGFTAAMTAPINNEGHVSAVVPIMVTGDPEELAAFEHLEVTRRTDESVLARQEAGLGRIADSIDLPREAMKGTIGEANHWSAWLIDAQTFDNHLAPACRLVVDSLTMSYFRRRLMAPAPLGWGLTLDEAMSVRVWYDASTLTRNTNRSADADAAMELGALSYDAYLKAKGFDPENDKADEEDLQRLQMIKSGRLDPVTMTQLAHVLLGLKEVLPASDRVIGADGQVIQGQTVPPSLPPGGQQPPPPARGQGPAQPIPQAPPGVAASAARTEDVLDSVKIIDSTVLADIDNALIEKIRAAAEAELAAALRKAGSKIKAQVQGKDAQLAAQLKGADPAAVGAMVGYDRLNELGLTEDILLAAAFVYLSGKFTSWSLAAIKQATIGLSDLIGLPLVTVNRLAQTMAERIPAAWKKLEGSLRARAMNSLYGRRGDATPAGEVPDTIILPGDIREALGEIGGQGGLAMGSDVLREVDHRAERVGFTWRYGITPRNATFHPHYQLSGQRFESFEDDRLATGPTTAWLGPYLHPGDHKGCMCDAVYSWMTDEADREAARVVGEESPAAHGDRVLAQLDDAAGRTGTHSQRARDLRDRMVEVQTAWLERRAPR